MFATCIGTATVNWIRRELSQVSFLESKTPPPPRPAKVHSFTFLFTFIALYLYTCAYGIYMFVRQIIILCSVKKISAF